MNHDEIEELLGAYALDAVDPEEARAVEDHLPGCPRCSSEVAAHREAAAFLAHAGAPAPEGLWQRISDTLEVAPPELDLARVTSLRPRPRGVSARLIGPVTAAAAVLSLVLGVQVVRQEQRLDRMNEAFRQRAALERVAESALADPTARRVQLKSSDGHTYAEAVLQHDGDGYMLHHNLPALPEHRTYQLWAMVGSKRVSLGVLGPKPDVVAFKVDGRPDGLAVSDEEAGGAATPTRPVARGSVPA